MLKFTQQQTQSDPGSRLREQIEQAVREARTAAEAAAKDAGDRSNADRVIVTAPAQGVPIVQVPPPFREPQIPPEAERISIAFFVAVAVVIIGLPLMRAIARRIERAGTPPPQIPNDVRQQLQQLTASVEAIAIEVERISEGQRFTTKMLAERAREGTILTPGAEA